MSSRLIPLFFLLISSVSNCQIEDLSFGTPETFDIMTWNIEQFPKNGQTTVNYVSDIIQNLEMDIIAIQEVDNINYFDQMVAGLSLYEGYLESSIFPNYYELGLKIYRWFSLGLFLFEIFLILKRTTSRKFAPKIVFDDKQ